MQVCQLNSAVVMNTTNEATGGAAPQPPGEDTSVSREGKVMLKARSRSQRSGGSSGSLLGQRSTGKVEGQLRYFAMVINQYGFNESVAVSVANNGRLLKVSRMANGNANEFVMESLRKVEVHAKVPTVLGLHFSSETNPTDLQFESGDDRAAFLAVVEQAAPQAMVDRKWAGLVPRTTWERFDVNRIGTAGMKKARILLVHAPKRAVYVIKPKYVKANRNVVPDNVPVEEVIGITKGRVQLEPGRPSLTRLRISNCGPAHPPASRPGVEYEFESPSARDQFCAHVRLMCHRFNVRGCVAVLCVVCGCGCGGGCGGGCG